MVVNCILYISCYGPVVLPDQQFFELVSVRDFGCMQNCLMSQKLDVTASANLCSGLSQEQFWFHAVLLAFSAEWIFSVLPIVG